MGEAIDEESNWEHTRSLHCTIQPRSWKNFPIICFHNLLVFPDLEKVGSESDGNADAQGYIW
jgi:hypothetical protein